MSATEPIEVVGRYVDEVLNGRQRSTVMEIFADDFRDYDPLSIPGVILPRTSIEGRIHILQQIELLADPNVDIAFGLEDVFHGTSGRVAYRVFGEGTVLFRAEHPPSSDEVHARVKNLRAVRKLAIKGSGLSVEVDSDHTLSALKDRLHVTYSCVGIMAVGKGKVRERWGRAILV